MEKEEKKKLTLLEKIKVIQQELKAPKNQYNSFGKYNYRSCEDILNAVKPLLEKLGLVLTLEDNIEFIGERYYVKAVATLLDLDSEMRMTNISYAREEETKKGMDGSQITGASSSYARKYCLNGLLLIDDVRDSDATNDGGSITKEDAESFTFETGKHAGWTLKRVVEEDSKFLKWLLNNSKDERLLKMIELLTGEVPLTDEEWDKKFDINRKLKDLIVEKDLDVDKICEYYKVKDIGELSVEQKEEIIEKKG